MAYEIPGFVLGTQIAGADLSALQYTFVQLVDGDNINTATAAELPLGVLRNAPAEGETCEIGTGGVEKVKCGGAIAQGAEIEVGASGRAVTLASGISVGTALEDGVNNQIISVKLNL